MPPRSSIRQRNATPARSTRAASTALVPPETPSNRRSTRNASRQPITAPEAVTNHALPEIHTQQSYAYGSSKTPALPEQLQSRELNLRAVANRLDNAVEEAELNFESYAAELREGTPESQKEARAARAQRRASREPSQPIRSPPSETPDDVRKKTRTAAWLDNSELDNITEEESSIRQGTQRAPQTPNEDREGSLASSFPTGSFDHSYNYERGQRAPDLPRPEHEPQPNPQHQAQVHFQTTRTQQQLSVIQSQAQAPQKATTPLHIRAAKRLKSTYHATSLYLSQLLTSIWTWLSHTTSIIFTWLTHIAHTLRKSLLELPNRPVFSALFNTLAIALLLSSASLIFCTMFTRMCDPTSSSIISQSFQRLCGSCTSSTATPPDWNFTTTELNDLSQLLDALKQTQQQISQIEARLNSRIDSSHASLSSDALTLRTHQIGLEEQIRRLSSQQPSHDSSTTGHFNYPNPILPKINFFSTSSGAVVLPHLTSPTRAWEPILPIRIVLRALRLRKTISPPPITALEPWLDEGDCWCAAETPSYPLSQSPNSQKNKGQESEAQDSIRLTIQTSQKIYPTELVIEHYPAAGSLEPGTAPKEIELWADFSSLSPAEWKKVHIDDLIEQSPLTRFSSLSLSSSSTQGQLQTWARIGTALYQHQTSSSSSSSSSPLDDSDSDSSSSSYVMDASEPYGMKRTTSQTTVGAKNAQQARNEESNHVQRFSLDINQYGLLHYSERFMVRVKRNWGARYTCLYRVRLHGLPVVDGDGD